MKRFLLSLTMLCACFGLMAQRTISGVVSDAMGGLPGANVMIKGTSTGVATDMDGNYSISVNNGDVLEVSYMGYTTKTQKVTAKTPSTLNFSMEEDSKMMDEVVVEVGYGKMRKSDLTGSLSSLGEDAMKAQATVSVDQALAGRVSGVQVSSSSGQPGQESSVRIRGVSTLTGNSDPLYVVDGMPIGGGKQSADANPLASINPADIVSMEVLKDASATAIYGSRAANGVIMITTRKGKEGGAKIAYSGNFSVANVSNTYDLMNLQEYASFYSDQTVADAFRNSPSAELIAAARYGGGGTDWQDEIYRTAIGQQHQISITGGSKETQYAFSLGYTKQNGVMINTDYQRFNGRANIETQIKKWLRTGISLAYTRSNKTMQDGFDADSEGDLEGMEKGVADEAMFVQALITPPSLAPTDFDGNFVVLSGEQAKNIKDNAVRMATQSPIYASANNVIGQVHATIQFPQNISWRNEFGIDYTGSQEQRFQPSITEGNSNSQQFYLRNNMYWRFASTLNYEVKMGVSKKHRLGAMLGYETWRATWEGTGIRKTDYADNNRFIDPDYQNTALGEITVLDPKGQLVQSGRVSGYKGASSMMSYFARLNYNYDERYMLTATGRFDGSSTLAPENRWDFFPSFAAAWRIDQESFMKDNDIKNAITQLKLRLGYGQTGNAGQDMAHITSYKQLKTTFGSGLISGIYANPYLVWETNWQINAGIDASFLRRDRINLTFDFFYKQNDDLILEAEPGITLGYRGDDLSYTSVPNINGGSIKNVGFDINLTTTNIDKKLGDHNFVWNTDINFSKVRNEILKLVGDDLPDGHQFKSLKRFIHKNVVGYAPGMFYGYKMDGLIQNTEQLKKTGRKDAKVGDINYVDIDGDGKITPDDQTFIGDPNPDFTFGMDNRFSWGPWSISLFISGSYGNDVYNLMRSKLEGMDENNINQLATVLDYAKVVTNPDGTQYVENSNTNMPIPNSGSNGGPDAISSRYVEDGSYLRFQNLSIGYTVPKRYTDKLHLSNLRVNFNVQNLGTITNYSGLNPEVPNASAIKQGVDKGGYPLPRTYVIGLNFDF